MLDRIDLPQGALDLLILRTLAQRHPGKSVGRTYSSILQDNGEDVKVVQELLRHSSSKMTLDVYAQALTPTKRAAQRKVVAMIREDFSGPRSVAKMFVGLDGHVPAIASTPKTTMRFTPLRRLFSSKRQLAVTLAEIIRYRIYYRI